ncbi:MAG TPA: hypothetical protein VGO67_19315 [Verrucomicrobiae bacterium]|jgi:hypothetical protein
MAKIAKEESGSHFFEHRPPGAKLNNKMKTQKKIFLGAATLALAAVAAYATSVSNVTFHTIAYFIGITQGSDPVTGHPKYENADFAGHNLVNLAMGRSATEKETNQVLAMTFSCDLSSAKMIVYDRSTSNEVATIATSTTMDSVLQQDNREPGPNRAHFVAVFQLGENGNSTNGLVSGYFTVAGRVNLDPTNGCPMPVRVLLDRDSLDRQDDDVEIAAKNDPDWTPLTLRTGLAHLIGVVDAVTDGNTNTILIPYGGLSIRRELPEIPSVVSPPITTSTP